MSINTIMRTTVVYPLDTEGMEYPKSRQIYELLYRPVWEIIKELEHGDIYNDY